MTLGRYIITVYVFVRPYLYLRNKKDKHALRLTLETQLPYKNYIRCILASLF